MTPGSFRFDRFELDPGDRELKRDGTPVELNGRYLDALTLLVREHGKLVTKSRFFEEVWRGTPVTDEALTQCIRTLRRQLGDDAASPRFIQTVPKHGYRFVAPVVESDADATAEPQAPSQPEAAGPRALAWRRFWLTGLGGTLGGAVAGVLVGLAYGLGAAAQPLQPAPGAISLLLVLVCVGMLLASVAAAGVSFGLAAAAFATGRAWLWSIAGGAAGGLVTGGFGELLGLDAFNLLFGQSPGDITGAFEGALVGAAVGLGVWLALLHGRRRLARIALAAAASGAAGLLIALSGGRLLGGSLALLVQRFPDARLRLDPVGALFGEQGFGPASQAVTASLEALTFGGCVVGAIALARRWSDRV